MSTTTVARSSSQRDSGASVGGTAGGSIFDASKIDMADVVLEAMETFIPPSIGRSKHDATLHVFPKLPHSATVFVLHGLGEQPRGWLEIVVLWAKELPHVKWVIPQAPTSLVSVNDVEMPSWYNIKAIGHDLAHHGACKGIVQSRTRIMKLVKNEVEVHRIPFSRIAIVGFSQGAALALYTGLQFPARLAGIAVLSGYLPKEFEVKKKARETHVLQCHGDKDPIIPIVWADKVQDFLTSQKMNKLGCVKRTYPGLRHGMHLPVVRDVLEWLEMRLPELRDFGTPYLTVHERRNSGRRRGSKGSKIESDEFDSEDEFDFGFDGEDPFRVPADSELERDPAVELTKINAQRNSRGSRGGAAESPRRPQRPPSADTSPPRRSSGESPRRSSGATAAGTRVP